MCAALFYFCGGENLVFCVEKASRSTLVDVVAMHKSESPSSLQTPIGFVYGEPMHIALDRLD
jgi:tRNA(Arg) A34 adenosine deaminase TadA